MRVTKFSDFALRILIFLEAQPKDRLTTIAEISNIYSISTNHVRVVVHKLGKLGYIDCIQGKGGGIKLGKDASTISVGDVVRDTENDFYMVECFDPDKETNCAIEKACKLKGVMREALNAFLSVLDQYTIADLAVNKISILKQLEFDKTGVPITKGRAVH